MTTFEALPTPPDDELIVTPATLPLSELMQLTSFCTLYDSAFSERLIPRAVTTTASTSTADSRSVKVMLVRLPTACAIGS